MLFCSSAQFRARIILGLGHQPQLLPPSVQHSGWPSLPPTQARFSSCKRPRFSTDLDAVEAGLAFQCLLFRELV